MRGVSYGWHVQKVTYVVTQLDDLREAVKKAQAETGRPSLIGCKTLIGYGNPSKEGTHGAHGAPLGAEDLAGAKENYGLPSDKSFYVPPEVQVRNHLRHSERESNLPPEVDKRSAK